MKNFYKILIRPLLTEKAVDLKDESNYYAFVVDKRANKKEVAEAVEKAFDVKVDKVRIVNVHPKPRRYGRFEGKKAGYKKAYVKLKEGEKKIEYFENI